MKTYYRRKDLPHIHRIGATFGVTFVVHDAIPSVKMEALRQEKDLKIAQLKRDGAYSEEINEVYKEYEERLEDLLNKKSNQEYPFRNAGAAEVLKERILLYHGSYYLMVAACIMPNHVHLMLDFSVQVPDAWVVDTPIPGYKNLDKVIGQIKGSSARLVNQALNRSGALWKPGYYDRYIRNDKHWQNQFDYILNNPVKAKLVKHWRDYPYTIVPEK